MVAWNPIPAIAFTFGEVHQGQTFQAPLGSGGARIEIRIGRATTRVHAVPLRDQPVEPRVLAWAHLVRGTASIPRLATRGKDGRCSSLGRHAPDGLGWVVHELNLGDGPNLTVACVALGTRLGPQMLPLPRRPPLSTTANLAEVGANAAGLPLDAEAVDILRRALGRSWIEPDGAARLGSDHLLGPLLEGTAGRALGEAAGTLLWLWLRHQPTGIAGVADTVLIREDCGAVMRLAAEEARSAGATGIAPGHLLVALARQEQTRSARLLMDAGFDAARLRVAVLGASSGRPTCEA